MPLAAIAVPAFVLAGRFHVKYHVTAGPCDPMLVGDSSAVRVASCCGPTGVESVLDVQTKGVRKASASGSESPDHAAVNALMMNMRPFSSLLHVASGSRLQNASSIAMSDVLLDVTSSKSIHGTLGGTRSADFAHPYG